MQYVAIIPQEFIDADDDSHRAGVCEAEKTNVVDNSMPLGKQDP